MPLAKVPLTLGRFPGVVQKREKREIFRWNSSSKKSGWSKGLGARRTLHNGVIREPERVESGRPPSPGNERRLLYNYPLCNRQGKYAGELLGIIAGDGTFRPIVLSLRVRPINIFLWRKRICARPNIGLVGVGGFSASQQSRSPGVGGIR